MTRNYREAAGETRCAELLFLILRAQPIVFAGR